MNIVILGGGLSGCSLAYLLHEKHPDYDITLIEKQKETGGLCRTFEHGGIKYEYGPHILYSHSDKLKRFFEQFLQNKEHPFYQYLSVDGKLDDMYNYPITVAGVTKINPGAAVELYHINEDKPDYSSLENYIISSVGRTAYEYFFKYYNIKQWGINPKKIDVEWIRQRKVFLRDHVTSVFGDRWQGHPGDYNPMFNKLTENITVLNEEVLKYNGKTIKTSEGTLDADLFINTTPLDTLMYDDYMFNYRGVTWVHTALQG